MRRDWTREEIAELFDLPLTELLFRAAEVHRANHPADQVQLCTLLSIKTGGCPEDCGYCSQSVKADSGVAATKLMDVREVLESAARAKDAGSQRFCMGAAWRNPKDRDMPAIVEIVSWAAGNGDRSENGDYLYGRKRMREIDRELAHLARRMKAAKVIDPAQQPDHGRVWFGATVTIADEDDDQRTLTLVGDDEQDASANRIGWSAPIARTLRGAALGDLRVVRLPQGEKEWEVVGISYPAG